MCCIKVDGTLAHRAELLRRHADAPGVHREHCPVTGQLPPRVSPAGRRAPVRLPVFVRDRVQRVPGCWGPGARAAYLLPMLPAFVSVYGMIWQLARQDAGQRGQSVPGVLWLFFHGQRVRVCAYFPWQLPRRLPASLPGFTPPPPTTLPKTIVWVNPIVDLLIPQRATLFGWCVLFPALYLLWRFAYGGVRPGFGGRSPCWYLPLPLMHTHSALALVLLCLAGGLYTLARRPRTAKAVLAPWLGLACLGVRRGAGWPRCPEHRAGPIAGRAPTCCGCTSTGSTGNG